MLDPCGRRQGSGRGPVLGDTLPVIPKGGWRAGTEPRLRSHPSSPPTAIPTRTRTPDGVRDGPQPLSVALNMTGVESEWREDAFSNSRASVSSPTRDHVSSALKRMVGLSPRFFSWFCPRNPPSCHLPGLSLLSHEAEQP